MNAQARRAAATERVPPEHERRIRTPDGRLITLSPEAYAALERVSLLMGRAQLALLEAREKASLRAGESRGR